MTACANAIKSCEKKDEVHSCTKHWGNEYDSSHNSGQYASGHGVNQDDSTGGNEDYTIGFLNHNNINLDGLGVI